MESYQVLSADGHVFEPPDLWSTRIDAQFRSRAPRLVRQEDRDWWYCEGRTIGTPVAGANPGTLHRPVEELNQGQYIENVLPGGYDPDARIKDMDLDGVTLEIIYPTIALGCYRLVDDPYLLNAIFRAYNDWLAEFCSAHPKRLLGIGLVNVDIIAEAVREMERVRRKGLIGAMITVYPKEGWSYDRPEYDAVWAAAQDLGMPLSLHVASNRPGQGLENVSATTQFAVFVNRDHWLRMSLAHIISSGVFARYAKLKIGSIEHELAFVPHFLRRLDKHYSNNRLRVGLQGGASAQQSIYGSWIYKDGDLPSDIIRRHLFFTFQDDPLGIKDRHIIGVENLCWGSDYPHPEATFPRSREVVAQNLQGLTDEEKRQILGGNVARVYGLK